MQNRYLIKHRIKKSGMGAVYEAIDKRFQSTVAIKQILTSNDEFRNELQEAFEREARLLNKLRHPVLPVVHDYFMEGEGQFLVMQYISGQDLEERLKTRGKPFGSDEVLLWADQLLDTLEYLHGQDPPIIHRDIKPANLKLTGRGELVLLDFGLAKDNQERSIHGYTQQYASPEQIQGFGTDPRSDLYSLAATLYRLITGELPPDALTRAGYIMRGQPDPLPPAIKINSQVPIIFSEILYQAMRLNPDERFPSARAMRDATKPLSEPIYDDLLDAPTQVKRANDTAEASRRRFQIPLEKLNHNSALPASSSGTTHTIPLEPSDANDQEPKQVSLTLPPPRSIGSAIRSYLSKASVAYLVIMLLLVTFLGILVYKVWNTVAAYRVYKEASQLMKEPTEQARRQALERFKAALAFSEAGGSKIGQADTLYNMGLVYSELGDKQMALDHYNRALTIYREKADRQAEANTLQGIGAVYSKFGEPQKAQQYYDMARAIR